mmetsp:Transcript_112234/g.198846  ORF Transcript_112234/g.198846 Transcript_112234/m.198846 type:complete len:99 (+) Transcript_112234:518-814(+)
MSAEAKAGSASRDVAATWVVPAVSLAATRERGAGGTRGRISASISCASRCGSYLLKVAFLIVESQRAALKPNAIAADIAAHPLRGTVTCHSQEPALRR